MRHRVLLLEDDAALGRQVVERLSAAGFEPRWLREGRLLPPAELREVSLVVLDLMLPGAYGLDVLKHLRETSDVPVLVLSARSDTADKVRALQLGADDYLTKPFWPEELLERVRARLRRPVLDRGQVIAIGPLRIDRQARDVRVDGEPVEVTQAELDLLCALAQRPGEAIPRARLSASALGSESGERTLDVHVSRLRKKLGRRVPIETVWGVGYRLAARSEA